MQQQQLQPNKQNCLNNGSNACSLNANDVLKHVYPPCQHERWCMTGFRYDPSSLYYSYPDIVIGAMVQKCQYCKALKWSGEPPGLCCFNGKVVLDDLAYTPDLLSEFLLGQ
jgi:hypothetical protein